MADFAGERTEEATPRRRQEARRKGTVARSVELTNSVVLVALLMALPMVVQRLGGSLLQSMRFGLSEIPLTARPSDLGSHAWAVLQPNLAAIGPLFALAAAVGLAANFAQVGFVLSGEALTPSLAKINPWNGLKRLFSAHAGAEGLKAVLKTALFGYLAWSVLEAEWPRLTGLAGASAGVTLGVIGDVLRTIFLRVAIAWLALAGADYFFQRRQVDKQLKMTKEELRQEFRQNEQAPELKSAMAGRRRRLVKGRMAQAVKTADAIITNPTHFSIAIQYDPKTMHAPQVVAKGADHLAFRIRQLAAEAKVPIVPNPPLARQLYKKCEVGDYVPRDLFQAVAEVLAYVYATIKKVRSAA